MKFSTVAKAWLLGLLAAIAVMVTDATLNELTVTDDGVIFKLRRFVDERVHLDRLIVKATFTSIFVIRSDGRVTSFNAATNRFSVEYDEITGEITDVIGPVEWGPGGNNTKPIFVNYDCDDCEEAWEVLCGPALGHICDIPDFITANYQNFQELTCTQITDVCASLTAEATCDGNCVEGMRQYNAVIGC